MHDVVVIGAGVIGCAIARELSRRRLAVAVLDAAPDIAAGASKANSGIVHAGYDAEPGSLKAITNIAGNAMFGQWADELRFPFKRIGSLVLCLHEESRPILEGLLARGRENGVPDLAIVDRKRLEEMEPNIGRQAVAALHAPSGGITCPYETTIALAENAAANGVEFHLNQKVARIERRNGGYRLATPDGQFSARAVVNAAGLHADDINNMVSGETMRITPRSGQYCLFDKASGDMVRHTLFQLPTPTGKGVLVTPTVDGNLLAGPTNVELDDKADVATRRSSQRELLRIAAKSVDALPYNAIITAFTGLRAHSSSDDFIIGETKGAPGFFNAAGIESPGLTAAPAIAAMVADMAAAKLGTEMNDDFNPIRPRIAKFREMDATERAECIGRDSRFGRVVCRCETVTEAEVVEAVRRIPGARDLDGVKRRTRAGMGRCQGGFCSPRIMEILARELGTPIGEITKSGPGSWILAGRNKMA